MAPRRSLLRHPGFWNRLLAPLVSTLALMPFVLLAATYISSRLAVYLGIAVGSLMFLVWLADLVRFLHARPSPEEEQRRVEQADALLRRYLESPRVRRALLLFVAPFSSAAGDPSAMSLMNREIAREREHLKQDKGGA